MCFKGKRKFAGFMALCMLLMSMQTAAVFADAQQRYKLYVDDIELPLSTAYIQNSILMIPILAVSDAFGAEATGGNPSARPATIDTSILSCKLVNHAWDIYSFEPDTNILHCLNYDGRTSRIPLSTNPVFLHAIMYVPSDLLTEGMGLDVSLNEDTKEVRIAIGAKKTHLLLDNYNPSDSAEKSQTDDLIQEVIQVLKEHYDQVYLHDQLAEQDLALLKESYADIRYVYEQAGLPEQLQKYQSQIVPEIHKKSDSAKDFANSVWHDVVLSCIVYLQTESEHAYIFDTDIPADEFFGRYMALIDSAGFTADNYFDISFESLPNNNTMMLLTFAATPVLGDCKYIGVVATAENTIRYFTGEKTLLDDSYLMLCEINPQSRGSIVAIKADKSAFLEAVKAVLAQ